MARIVDKPNKDQEKVAVYSSKNLFKYGLGELKIGYNIVTKEASEFWETHQAVRIATPEEVANAYIRSK
jgi:predicted transcriptional regulator